MEIKSGIKDKSAFAQSKKTNFSQMVASASLFSNFIRIRGGPAKVRAKERASQHHSVCCKPRDYF